ncbi:MAG: glycosyltransferase [Holosporales bacterium]|nr:glycosyltransferase [Holosporales bacterium]
MNESFLSAIGGRRPQLKEKLLRAGGDLRYIPISILDSIILPILIVYAYCLRFQPRTRGKTKILFGMMHNNRYVYVRDALKVLGYEAQVIPWMPPAHERGVIDYDWDIASRFPYLHSYSGHKNLLGRLLLVYGFFVWALYKFDVFIVPFKNRLLDRTSILSWFEFQLIHFAGKKVILNPYGGDITYEEFWENSDDRALKILLEAWQGDPLYSSLDSARTVRNTRYGERYADAVIAALIEPDFLNRVDYTLHMCIPPKIDTPLLCKRDSKEDQHCFTIVHATNHAHYKGTSFVEKAVDTLKKEGRVCEFIVLKNTPNPEVLSQMQQADVVFDQLLCGSYGRLGLEAMALGKPVICYLREDLKDLYPIWKECPVIDATVDNIKEVLETLMDMPREKLRKIGQQSRAYVEKYYSPKYVGTELDKIIQTVLRK